MRLNRTLQTRTGVVLALTLCTGGGVTSFAVAAQAAGTTAISQTDAVTARTALTAFGAALDAQRESATPVTGPQAKTLSMVLTAASTASAERLAFTQASLTITDSTTSIASPSRITVRDNQMIVEAEITTEVKSRGTRGESETSSWTDVHQYIVDRKTGSVVSDKTLPTPSDPLSSITAASNPTTLKSYAQPAINATKMADYALKYTAFPYTVIPQGNPTYPNTSNNCTNFASQALRNGGWSLKSGVNPSDSNNWTYNLTGPAGPSKTWSVASWLYDYARNKAGWTKRSSIWDSTRGDLIMVDWDPNGRADGKIDHTMIVTGVINGVYKGYPRMPMISQKTSNRHNIPLTMSIQLAKEQGKTKIVWYPLKHR